MAVFTKCEFALHTLLKSDKCDLSDVNSLLNSGININFPDISKDLPIHHAVQNPKCSHEVINALLENHADVNAKNEQEMTPLHLAVAAEHCKIEIVQELLKFGADVDARNRKFDSVLHLAIRNKSCGLEVISELLYAGAEVNTKDSKNYSPLAYAVSSSSPNYDIILELIKHCANVCHKNNYGNSILHLAAGNSHCGASIIKLLLQSGASARCKNLSLLTPLHCLMKQFNPAQLDIIDKLINYNADINALDRHQMSPLNFIVKYRSCCGVMTAGDMEVVKKLIKYGANVATKDVRGHTPLHTAVWHPHLPFFVKYLCSQSFLDAHKCKSCFLFHDAEDNVDLPLNITKEQLPHCRANLIALLLSAGARPNAESGKMETPLHLVVTLPHMREIVVKQLLMAGGGLNKKSATGETVLHSALRAYNCDVEFVKLLLHHGADINIPDGNMHPPLIVALLNYNHVDTIALLLDKGADPNALSFGGVGRYASPLHIAVSLYSDKIPVIRELFKHGASVNVLNYEQKTPLHEALMHINCESSLVDELLRHGVYNNSKDNAGQSAFHVAISSSCNVEVIKVLIKHGLDFNLRDDNGHTPLSYAFRSPIREIATISELLKSGAESTRKDFLEAVTLTLNILRNNEPRQYARAFECAKLLIKYYLLERVEKFAYIPQYDIDFSDELVEYHSVCEAEVERMKVELVNERFSLYEMSIQQCLNTTLTLDDIAANIEEVIEILSQNPFPIYVDVLSFKLSKSFWIEKLMEQQFFVFSDIFRRNRVVLNSSCLYEIGHYLSNLDLLNVILAFHKCRNSTEATKRRQALYLKPAKRLKKQIFI